MPKPDLDKLTGALAHLEPSAAYIPRVSSRLADLDPVRDGVFYEAFTDAAEKALARLNPSHSQALDEQASGPESKGPALGRSRRALLPPLE